MNMKLLFSCGWIKPSKSIPIQPIALALRARHYVFAVLFQCMPFSYELALATGGQEVGELVHGDLKRAAKSGQLSEVTSVPARGGFGDFRDGGVNSASKLDACSPKGVCLVDTKQQPAGKQCGDEGCDGWGVWWQWMLAALLPMLMFLADAALRNDRPNV